MKNKNKFKKMDKHVDGCTSHASLELHVSGSFTACVWVSSE